MRRIRNYMIKQESIGDMVKYGRFNPSPEFTFRDKTGVYTHKIGAGTADYKDVYRKHGVTYLLTRNYRLGYVGLEVFKGSENLGEIFLQIDYELDEILGKNGIRKAAYNIIKILDQYIY